MKTVVIVENEAVELEALVDLFQQWQKEINILTATKHQAAISIMSKQHVDLVVCDLEVSGLKQLKDFSLLTHSFPYVPCIAISARKDLNPQEVVKNGASQFFSKPLDTKQLLQHAADLLDVTSNGTIRGIPIHSFLQMLETEQKTCTLEVTNNKEQGLLYIKDGTLIGAESKNFKGEEAAHLILSWQETILRLRYFNGQIARQIDKPLISIVMEAFRLHSDRQGTSNKLGDSFSHKHQLPLKHLSTLGKTIPLKIGSRVKLEFPTIETLQDSTIVGMLKDNCLVTTNPLPFSDLDLLVRSQQRIIVKYIHRGKVWMFKSQLLRYIESPSQLLFFDYPGVLHYHELRQAKRTSIFVPSTFRIGHSHELYGALIDLSTTGCLCRIKHKTGSNFPNIELNMDITLRCLLPGLKEEQQICGKIRNYKIDTQVGDTKLGIEFIDLQPHISETINKYLISIESISA